MGEVIVRMEMSKNCAECGLVDENDRCVLLGTFAGDKSVRIPKCPIKGVLPEQHGRLVDERELFARCRPVKNFDNPDALVIVKGAVIQSQTIVPATERSETWKN